MDRQIPYYMDRTISDPWFEDMDRNFNSRADEHPPSDWFPSAPSNQHENPDKISINNSKYYNLPCNCGLVDDIAHYQRLRTHIYFDTRSRDFYKSDISSTTILPNGFPYMACPRHSEYFSDVIRCNMGMAGCGEGVHQKIYLFDAASQHNYSLHRPTTFRYQNHGETGGEAVRSSRAFQHPADMIADTIAVVDNASSNRSGVSPTFDAKEKYTKHFPSCLTYQNKDEVCTCEEYRAKLRQRYIREQSAVVDVLADYGIDVVVSPEDFKQLNNPLFKHNGTYSGSRLARAPWVRRPLPRKNKSPKGNNSSFHAHEESFKQKRRSFYDVVSGSPNRSCIGANYSRYRNQASYLADESGHENVFRSCANNTRRTVTFDESLDMIESDAKKKRRSNNATFTVLTKPKRPHIENDEFTVDQNGVVGNTSQNSDGSRLTNLSQLKLGLPEEDLQRWVTVIGFQPRFVGHVVRFMSSFGPIIKIKSSRTCNYLHLMYSKAIFAQNAVNKATFKLDNSMIASIKPCTNTFIPNEQVHCFDPEKSGDSFYSTFNVSNCFSWITSAVSKVVNYVDGFINEL